MATRCCWPPESWLGRWLARSAIPNRASSSDARRWRSRADTPAYSSGMATFSQAVCRGSRWNPWNTKPILRFRSAASSVRDSRLTSSPSKR